MAVSLGERGFDLGDLRPLIGLPHAERAGDLVEQVHTRSVLQRTGQRTHARPQKAHRLTAIRFGSIYRGAHFEQLAPLLAWICETCSPRTCAGCAMRRGSRRTISPMKRK